MPRSAKAAGVVLLMLTVQACSSKLAPTSASSSPQKLPAPSASAEGGEPPLAAVDARGYAPIPPRFGWPASEAYLEDIRKRVDVKAQRVHVWNLFAGLTAPTATGNLVFETWFSKAQTFSDQLTAAARPKAWPALEGAPHRRSQPRGGAHASLSDIAFNQEGFDWIRQAKLYSKAELTRINEAWPPGTPWEKRNVPESPRAGIVLKIVYWPIKQDAPTPLPMWDFDPEHRISPQDPEPANPNTTWKRVVAISPTAVAKDQDVPIEFNGKQYQAHLVSLDRLRHYTLDEQQAATLRDNVFFAASVDLVFGPKRPIRAGDHVALVAMHVATKEIPDWVWGSIWWHDAPDDGPLATYRPPDIRGVWRNYLMTSTFDFYTPKEPDGSPSIAYNPWLEAVDPNGISSNCMSCHARASWPGVCSTVVTRGANDPFYNAQEFKTGKDPAYDGTRTHLDFLWSIYFESNPKIPEDKPTLPCEVSRGGP